MLLADAKAEKTGGSMRLVDGSMKAKSGELHSPFLIRFFDVLID
jgi:hypothetical protein